ncbi:MAG: methyl-accepting chemotaxis protein [Treponema sp.]|nr:methyl-accepting chemotaxis protein [Treponema sp.]MBR7079003.1 methyl-accepting chemotaxis protein [Treponema sp.]
MNFSFVRKFFSQKPDESFTTFMYRTSLTTHLILTFLPFSYSLLFLNLPSNIIGECYIVLGLTFFALEFFIVPLANYFSAHYMSSRLHKFDQGKLNEENRNELLSEVLHFPLKKAFLTIFFALLQIIAICVFLKYKADFTIRSNIRYFFICMMVSYLVILVVFDRVQTICSRKAISIVSMGVSDNYVNSKKYLGFSLITLFIFYVIIPFVISGVTTYISSLSFNLLNSIIIALLNLLFTTSFALIYFRKIKKYTDTVQDALHSLSDKNIKNSNIIPVDLSTELSYTIYMVNQTIKLFTTIIEQTSQTNEEINIASQNLSSISEETASTSIEQSTAVKEIVSTMEMTEELSQSIERKILEVNHLADKNMQDIEHDSKAIKLNLDKMQEIILANQSSIMGIQSLSNKIKSIWDIVNLIDGVADQTKIIAFNAELEAENIQEGKEKFKNVAQDIRTLADNVMILTKEIRSQIQQIQNASSQLIETGVDCTTKINQGNSLTLELEEKFKTITNSASQTLTSTEEIQKVVKDQTQAFNVILEKLQNISSGVEQFNVATHLIASTVQKLRKDSEYLKTLNNFEMEVSENEQI